MSLTPHAAWLIFRADKLGQEEGKAALKNMTGPEFQAYECLVEDFEFQLAQIGVEANNEAAKLMEASPELEYLTNKKPYLWDAADYMNVVTPFAGSKFEQLHLSAIFKVQNAELLLDLVKPA